MPETSGFVKLQKCSKYTCHPVKYIVFNAFDFIHIEPNYNAHNYSVVYIFFTTDDRKSFNRNFS